MNLSLSVHLLPLTVDSPEILAALKAWHESGRQTFEHNYPRQTYDDACRKTAKSGKRWLKLDSGNSGYYLVDLASPEPMVYTIKVYGVPKKCIGTLAAVTEAWRNRITHWASSTSPVFSAQDRS